MFKRIKEKVSLFFLNRKKNRLVSYYENEKYDKMVSMLSTLQSYNTLKLDSFPFLYFLIDEGKKQAIQALLKQIKYIPQIINDDQNPLKATPVFYALLQNQYQIVDILQRQGGNLNQPNSQLQNALHLAAIYKRVQSFRQAITKYKVDYNAIDQFGNTPFHYAARVGSVDMVSTLVACKAKKIANQSYQYPINMAIQSGNYECFQLLKNDLNLPYPKFHPLHSASRSTNMVIFQQVFNSKPAAINFQDYRGLTPLHHAVITENYAAISKILAQHNVMVNLKDEHGNTPLHLAVMEQNIECVTEILKKQPDLDIQNNDFLSPIDYGMESTKTGGIKSVLLEHGHRSKKLKEYTNPKF